MWILQESLWVLFKLRSDGSLNQHLKLKHPEYVKQEDSEESKPQITENWKFILLIF